jgi:hypothetical protein
MSLSVIGAGFGRTGTLSMKLALEALGFGPCHHMAEVLLNPNQLAQWRDVAQGNLPDWDDILAGYNSAIDWPSAYYWRELSKHNPDAKIILTVRSPESWYESFSKTILQTMGPENNPLSFGVKIINNTIFDGRPDDRAHAIAVYEKNTTDVQAAFPADRLLTYELGDGWEPLCKFFNKPIPDTPFPKNNSTEEFRTHILKS